MGISIIQNAQAAEFPDTKKFTFQANTTADASSIFTKIIKKQEKEVPTENNNNNKEIFNADEYDVENDPYAASTGDKELDEKISKIKAAGNKFNSILGECIDGMVNILNSDAHAMAASVSRGELDGKILTERNGIQNQICDKVSPWLVDMAFNTAIQIAGDDSLTDDEKEAKYQELEAQMRAMARDAIAEMNAATEDIGCINRNNTQTADGAETGENTNR